MARKKKKTSYRTLVRRVTGSYRARLRRRGLKEWKVWYRIGDYGEPRHRKIKVGVYVGQTAKAVRNRIKKFRLPFGTKMRVVRIKKVKW